MEYLVFKIVLLLGIGAALDRAYLASKKLWVNRLGREIESDDATQYESSPLKALLKSTGETVIVLPLLADSDVTEVDSDGLINESDLEFSNNLNNTNNDNSNDLGSSPSDGSPSSNMVG
jgi:hypothetical protein